MYYIGYLFGTVAISIFSVVIQLVYHWNASIYSPQIKESYDYIIVGYGTAGSLVANGLINDDVLVIEAGSKTATFLDVPILGPLLHRSLYDWSFETNDQKDACFGLKHRKSFWPMGRGIGGSNILNNMIYVRGNSEDFRGWFGNASLYDFNRDVLPYFEQAESLLKPSEIKYKTKFGNLFLKSAYELGYTSDEFYHPLITESNGWRWSSAYSFMNKHINRTLILQSKVERIIFDNVDNIPITKGLKFWNKNQEIFVHARKGIILSAGTIGSAEILLRSGIGPRNVVNSESFTLDLPVGQNLQDHVSTGLGLILLNTTTEINPFQVFSIRNLIKYFVRNDYGPLTFSGSDAIGFIKTTQQSVTPDIGFMVIPSSVNTDFGAHIRYIMNINDTLWKDYFESVEHSVSVIPILLHPYSRGTVTIENDKVQIDPQYLNDPRDVEILVKGIKELEQLLNADAIKELGAEFNPKPLPGCDRLSHKSDDYWRCYVKHLTFTTFHPVGTCRMDLVDGVVDYNFSVRDCKNLYVVDASVMPNLPSGNTNAVVAMLAQKFLFALKNL